MTPDDRDLTTFWDIVHDEHLRRHGDHAAAVRAADQAKRLYLLGKTVEKTQRRRARFAWLVRFVNSLPGTITLCLCFLATLICTLVWISGGFSPNHTRTVYRNQPQTRDYWAGDLYRDDALLHADQHLRQWYYVNLTVISIKAVYKGAAQFWLVKERDPFGRVVCSWESNAVYYAGKCT